MSGCEKESHSGTTDITLQNALTGYKWQLRAVSLLNAYGSSTNITSTNFKACELDDLLFFRSDGVFLMLEGGAQCNPPGYSIFGQLSGDTWTVNDSILLVGSRVDRQVYRVRAWNDKSMKWEQYQKNPLGEWETYVYQFYADR